MTYLEFLLIFLVPPILVMGFLVRKSYPTQQRKVWGGLLFLCTLALVYTTPWDNYLVKNEIWWYGPDKVLAVIGYVPVEEYCFSFSSPF